MNKIFLPLFMLSALGLYSADNAQLPMKEMQTLDELCHCGYFKKVIAYTTTLNRWREGAFTLGQDKEISYGIITCQKQPNSRIFPRCQIIMRTFKKMEAEESECSLGHKRTVLQLQHRGSDNEFQYWEDEFEKLFKKSNLAIRFATDAEKEQLENAINAGRAKLAYDYASYRKFARQCLKN